MTRSSHPHPTGTLRSLYLCYLSLDDPLVHTQVIAYLEGLAARGHHIHLLTYEPRRLGRVERRRIARDLRGRGIAWRALRYHKRPSLPATVYDALAGAVVGTWLVRRHRLAAVHARSHVPAAAALIIRRLTGCELIFDIRGLMAEEYVDAGRWPPHGAAFRITKAVERAAIARAAGIVVLTERIRTQLFGERARDDLAVIPCCADLARLGAAASSSGARVRARLGLPDAPAMVYVGKFAGWYMQREMVDFHAVAREAIGDLHFLVLTQDEPGLVLSEFERRGTPATAYTVTAAPPEEVGAILAAADFGISFIRAAPSKASSSPTKIGEYLGAGLPIVCGSGVGDLDALIGDELGVLVSEFDDAAYRATAQRIAALAADPAVAERCREAAREQLSLEGVGIPRYDSLYRRVARAPSRNYEPSSSPRRGRRAGCTKT
ncbi:MAG TPA: glycosyltransferase [Solirubrobacteraceae bacterium]|nr:glycosyltransferase [Solirubrobacteraceae bacterium]